MNLYAFSNNVKFKFLFLFQMIQKELFCVKHLILLEKQKL